MYKPEYNNIEGILTILAAAPDWPNSANIYVIPDEKGFALIDVGCGGPPAIEALQEGLRYWNLRIEQLHTVVLSHAHPDHMGAISWILEASNPKVYIHHLDIGPALDPGQLDLTFDIALAKDRWAAFNPGDDFSSLIELIVSDTFRGLHEVITDGRHISAKILSIRNDIKSLLYTVF